MAYKRHSQGGRFKAANFGDLGLRAFQIQQERQIRGLKEQAQEEKEINPDKFESSSPLRMQREENSIAAEIKNSPEEKEIKREEAMNKTKEFKRLRFAERSAEEQEATRGSFISTLQT